MDECSVAENEEPISHPACKPSGQRLREPRLTRSRRHCVRSVVISNGQLECAAVYDRVRKRQKGSVGLGARADGDTQLEPVIQVGGC